MIAAVRVRGKLDISQNTSRTLEDLNLDSQNKCVVFEKNDSILGMLDQAKDFITYGEVSDEVLEELAEKEEKDSIEHGDTVRLSPPSGGYKSTKKQVGQGGSLGKRDSVDSLLQKMV